MKVKVNLSKEQLDKLNNVLKIDNTVLKRGTKENIEDILKPLSTEEIISLVNQISYIQEYFIDFLKNSPLRIKNEPIKITYQESYKILNHTQCYNLFNCQKFSLNDFLNQTDSQFKFPLNGKNHIGVIKFVSDEDKIFFEENKAFCGCIIRTISGLFYKEEEKLLQQQKSIFQDNERPEITLNQLWKYISNDKNARIDRAQKRKEYLQDCIEVLKRTQILIFTITDKNATGDNQYAKITEQQLLPLEPYLSITAKGDINKGYQLTRVPLLSQLGIIDNQYINLDFKDDVDMPLNTINHITLFYGLYNFLEIQNPKKSPFVSLSLDRIYKENLNNYERDIKRPARLYNELEYVLDRLVKIKKINRHEKRKSKENPKEDIIDFFFYDKKTTTEIIQKKADEKSYIELIDTLSTEVEKNQRKRKKAKKTTS